MSDSLFQLLDSAAIASDIGRRSILLVIRTHDRTVRPRLSEEAIFGLPAWPAVDRTRRCRPRLRSVDGIPPDRAGDRGHGTVADQWATARKSPGKRWFTDSETRVKFFRLRSGLT